MQHKDGAKKKKLIEKNNDFKSAKLDPQLDEAEPDIEFQ